MINIICAYDLNRGIGINNQLPWGKNMRTDLKRFQQLTTAKIVVMGRKTYQSIGNPLVNRVNIVMTNNKDFHNDIDLLSMSCAIVNDIETVLRLNHNNTQIFVIGGSQIYDLYMPYADRLYITEVKHEFQCDAHFPEIGNQWIEKYREEHQKDYINAYDYDFVIYDRVKENNSK
jgi:dihydrofolate reductase